MKNIAKIVSITFALVILVLLIFSEVARWIIFSLLGPFIQLLLGPIIISIKLFDIVYPAFVLSFLISILSIYILARLLFQKKHIAIVAPIIFITFYVPSSIYLGEQHIHSIANAKYGSEAKDVSINLGGWYKIFQGNHFGFPGHDRHLGDPHGYILQNNKKCNWSFSKRDFICLEKYMNRDFDG